MSGPSQCAVWVVSGLYLNRFITSIRLGEVRQMVPKMQHKTLRLNFLGVGSSFKEFRSGMQTKNVLQFYKCP